MSEFRLEIRTADRRVIVTEVESVLLPTAEGVVGVWANHAPMLVALDIGLVRFGDKFGQKRTAAVAGGIAQVQDNQVIILSSSAELAEEIDVLRAKQNRDLAEQRIQNRQSELDFVRAQVALRKALNRLMAAESSGNE